jgi:hypothetical protein
VSRALGPQADRLWTAPRQSATRHLLSLSECSPYSYNAIVTGLTLSLIVSKKWHYLYDPMISRRKLAVSPSWEPTSCAPGVSLFGRALWIIGLSRSHSSERCLMQ